MDKDYFIQLLQKHLKGETTVEEDQLVSSYYNLFELEPDVLAMLSPEEKERLKESMFAVIRQNIFRGEQRQARVLSMRRWIRISAAAAVVAATLLITFQLFQQKSEPQQQAATKGETKTQNHLLQLPDGSTVLLSDGSKIHYAPSFDQSGKRDVYLQGRAYFDIKHDPSRPFTVYAGNVKTTVLGTAFEVNAIQDEPEVSVTVTRGKVKVSNPKRALDLVTPDQQLVYDKKKGRAIKKTVDAAALLRWKDEADLLLDNVTLEEAANVLQERFRVSISFADTAVKRNQFTTILLKEESLEQIIKSICTFHNVSYRYDKEKSALVIRPGEAPVK